MQRLIKFWRYLKDYDIKIEKNKWVGPTQGLTAIHEDYTVSLFCNALMSYRMRKCPTFKIPITDLIFSIKRNKRMALLIWHTDITVLGFTLQIEKHKPDRVIIGRKYV